MSRVDVELGFGQKKTIQSMETKKFKLIPGESLVKISQVLADISYYTETRTNVAGTNVALSNVPKRVIN